MQVDIKTFNANLLAPGLWCDTLDVEGPLKYVILVSAYENVTYDAFPLE